MLGINAGPDPIEELEVFLSAFQVSFPILLDTGTITNQYRQTGALSPFPLDYVIDPDGDVAYFSTEYDPDAMVAVIDDLLATHVAVDEVPPASLSLTAAPNPFNPRTEISFVLPGALAVTLDVHDARGRRVRRLLDAAPHDAGRHALGFAGRDDAGRELAAGVYLLRMQAGDRRLVHKLTLLR